MTGSTVNKKQFLTRVEYVAAHLIKHGFNREVPVTFAMLNCIEYVIIASAVWCLDGKVATINPLATSGKQDVTLSLFQI